MSDEATDVDDAQSDDPEVDEIATTVPEAEAAPVDPNAVTVTLNGRDIAATKGEMVITAALREDEYGALKEVTMATFRGIAGFLICVTGLGCQPRPDQPLTSDEQRTIAETRS